MFGEVVSLWCVGNNWFLLISYKNIAGFLVKQIIGNILIKISYCLIINLVIYRSTSRFAMVADRGLNGLIA